MRLAVITPKIDADDDLFGHVASWMDALARRVDRLYVIALWSGQPYLPANARFASLGKGETKDKLVWLVRLQQLLGRLCLGGRVDAVLAHMAPVFAVASGAPARLGGVPLFLWYAHGHVSPMLRVAHVLVDGVGTSTSEGFRIPSDKVTITGQGIDTVRFAPRVGTGRSEPTILSVGRFSPIKDYVTLLDAVAQLGDCSTDAPPSVELVGGTHSRSEDEYLATLQTRVECLGIANRITFRKGVPYSHMPAVYSGASIFATCSRTGSLDKAVLEAACCGSTPIVCSEAFRSLFSDNWPSLSFTPGHSWELTDRLAEAIDRPDRDRMALAAELRGRIEIEHSVGHWADAVLRMIQERSLR